MTIIREIFGLTRTLGKKPFKDIVKESCGFEITPIVISESHDKMLIDTITKSLKNFLKISRQGDIRYKANRVNDAGKKMESAIVEEMRKTSLNPEKLGSSGYPDLFVTFEGEKCYIELKTSAQRNKAKTHHRLFYFTSGKKIKENAHHLLLQIQISEETDKYWKVEYWELRDLYNLKVGLKTEWNANQQDFENAGLLRKGA